jgi:hypothetical protein
VTCHRRYFFEQPGNWSEPDYNIVLRILQHACEVSWWYNEPEVQGQDIGQLNFSFTVSARDQWWAHKRAIHLATTCYVALGRWEKDVPVPMWRALEPHTNRGRYRVPR